MTGTDLIPYKPPIVLRDYQRECIRSIVQAGSGRWLVVMATGLGKTVTFANIPRPGRLLIISHRDELVHQPIRYFDCPVGVEMAGEHSHGEPVVSASIQTLSRASRLGVFRRGDFDTVITDEAHHAVAPAYMKVIDWLKPRVHLGFTATVNRMDGHGLADAFDDIIYNKDLKWGIRNGWLTDIDCRRVKVDWDTNKLKRRDGDFSPSSLRRMLEDPKSDDQILAAIDQYAIGQTLVFAGSVEHAHRLADRLGDRARCVDGTTKRADRRAIIDAFTNRRFQVLINYGVFTEGTDLPLIETIIMARPTMNESLYAQMVGRGLRPSPGKDKLRLVDVVSNTSANRLVTAPDLYGLDTLDEPDANTSPVTILPPQELLDGSLDTMGERLEQWMESSPAGWVLRASKADLIGMLVAWMFRPDGARFVTGDHWTAAMTRPDQLGHVTLDCSTDDGHTLHVGRLTERQADQKASDWLTKHAKRDAALWSTMRVAAWATQPATSRQLDRIRRAYTTDELQGIDLKRLNRHQASMLIGQRPVTATPEQITRLRRDSEGTTVLDGVDLKGITTDRVRELHKLIDDAKAIGVCPVCGAHVVERNGAWRCENTRWTKTGNHWEATGCGFDINRQQVEQHASILRQLLATGAATANGVTVTRTLIHDRNGAIRLGCEPTDKTDTDTPKTATPRHEPTDDIDPWADIPAPEPATPCHEAPTPKQPDVDPWADIPAPARHGNPWWQPANLSRREPPKDDPWAGPSPRARRRKTTGDPLDGFDLPDPA